MIPILLLQPLTPLIEETNFGQNNLIEIFSLAVGVVAIILLVISLMSYKKVKLKRLLLISAAFALFAVKTMAMHIDLVFPNVNIGNVAELIFVFIDFMILLLFFLAVVKK